MDFPILYKQTKTGAIQTYQVSTNDATIIVTQGQIDGKKQSYQTTCIPKNVGKSNESTGIEQAILEAKSKHASKLKGGYSTNPFGVVEVQRPMKVKVYKDQYKNVKFPCAGSPKLNGVNATYTLVNDELILTSRGGEVYPRIPHLEADIRTILTDLSTDRIAGELYIHNEHLQDITALVKKTRPESSNLEFHIFDLPNIGDNYRTRHNTMLHISDYSHVHVIPSYLCASHAQIDNLFHSFIAAGYEGAVIYNFDGLYEYNTRSSDVFKFKQAQDAEFKFIGYSIDKNGHPILECLSSTNLPFSVKPMGTNVQRLQLLSILDSHINQWYTVEFETLSKSGIPLKPVGIAFRNCDQSGNPIE